MRRMSSGLLRQWQRRLLRYISSLASLGLVRLVRLGLPGELRCSLVQCLVPKAHGNGGREVARNTGHPGLRIRALSNTSNSCFANALIQALTAVRHRGFDLGQWQSVINQLVNSAGSKPISLFGMFEFHHLISGWRLDGRQHDVAAAEFLAHLQRSLRDAWIP